MKGMSFFWPVRKTLRLGVCSSQLCVETTLDYRLDSTTKDKIGKKSRTNWGSFLPGNRGLPRGLSCHTVDGSGYPLAPPGCTKPCKSWDKLPTSTGEFTGFFPPKSVRNP